MNYEEEYDEWFGGAPTFENFMKGMFWAVITPETDPRDIKDFEVGTGLSLKEVDHQQYTVYITTTQGELVTTGNINLAKNHVDKRFQPIENFK